MQFRILEVTTEEQLQFCRDIRVTVFVDEQGVPLADEFDQWDAIRPEVRHIIALEGDRPAGTSRLRFVDGYAKLERICILPSYRKYGLGRLLLAKLEELARAAGAEKAKLHGQVQAEGFYTKLGYSREGGVFDEDGIPHALMVKQLV
ncbi:GNAT family N-acetyltransferase [Saccharibacillus kuerlensis]|uniref:Acetyltransferase n=1 Tax=Saccharibacillus kuerlensis TaxID=459527 RepID=A0ABQ2L4K1_9BACL|nr:GNAT family N-acetyltransferase [Saccharibacillus kuerlensis]GGO02858.1 acetyltransferase [Saccharibacillus kuerlensis]